MDDIVESGVLSLAGAQRVSEAAIAAAKARGLSIAVAVSGPAGDLRAFARMDGVAPLAAETARRKCWTVAITGGRSTRDFGEGLKGYLAEEPQLFHGMLRIGDMVAFPGGVPIRSHGLVIGAVAVSGASSVEDHELAEQATLALTA
jgi:glc operon protein GlcG